MVDLKARRMLVAVALGCALAGCGSTAEPAVTETEAPAVDSGIPPEPDAATGVAYLKALRAIDPAIVGDKDDERVIDRGRDQCSSVKDAPDDQAKLVDLTNQRFTAPERPAGFGEAKAAKILAAVRKYICPAY